MRKRLLRLKKNINIKSKAATKRALPQSIRHRMRTANENNNKSLKHQLEVAEVNMSAFTACYKQPTR